MKPEIMIVLAIFLTFASLEAVFTSFHKKPHQTHADVIVESVSTVATLGLIQPFIVLTSATLLGWVGCLLRAVSYLIGHC
jgi:Trk-type K+ transport system membrane component